MSLRIILGVDPDDVTWEDFAVCTNLPINSFYDDYESDASFAATIDDICISCPVQKECLMQGVRNNEYGVWGGVFLTAGKADPGKNQHKTADIWKVIREKTT